MKRSKEVITKNHNQEEINVLRCWKCRKCIASSGCLMKYLENQVIKDSYDSADDHDACRVWHMNIEALPEWINCLIQKAQWTVGKLNCPFCGARLGGFNFVSSPKCACGQRAAVHLSRSRTDCQPARAGRLTTPPLRHSPHPRVQSGGGSDTLLTGGAFRNRNRRPSAMAQKSHGPGRLTEALCLEVGWAPLQVKKEKLLFKASDSKCQLFVPQLGAATCPRRALHRKSHSLDLSVSEKLTFLPTFCEIRSKTAAHPRLREAPSEPGKLGRPFPVASGLDPDTPLQRFSAAPRETQAQRQRGGELQHALEASAAYAERAGSDSLAFLVDLPSGGRSALEASDQEERLSPLHFLGSGSFSLGAINQRLSKRERSKLKNLRRKQRRHERWLQKQTLTNDMSTDDENEYVEEKESYICAVCLDVYFNPYMCYPCHHIFCEPCLRTLAKDNPASTPCPLCRTIISRVFFQTELNNATKTFFTKEYLKIKQSFQKSSSAKWPLPSCKKKAFHLFGGFHRRAAPVTRRQFPHGAHRMDYLHFEDDSRGWWFDMDMVIIYIYSVNWIIGFIVFCFLCYFFFPF
ncbi:PREDICTED: E3 ubiquitin-protein ligase RNF180 isoform X2 [Miniopterus natalensis]|uniref:E3 ubiquitin-protein ligase RNF180 isoform X2 n=1 Tax=Miniopterus natalensis TaxID=291302 RepID=UPI0007A6B98C|nr:PREDICTED: E3 ubiquitin-protein ligase RNF180 isoform X2 [Miniopterus natalensis]